MNLYIVVPDVNNYDKLFSPAREERMFLLEFSREYYVNSVHLSWKPIHVEINQARKLGDFFGIGCDLAMNQKAWEILAPLIQDNVEPLPLIHESEKYYYIKLLDKLDCLDRERAVYHEGGVPHLLIVDSYAFQEEMIGSRNIFWLEYVNYIIVSQAFKNCVEEFALEGLLFQQVS